MPVGALSAAATATRPSISLAALFVKVSSRMLPRGHTLLEQPRHAIGQSACLAAAGAGNDKSRARCGRYGRELLLVQLRCIINAGGKARRSIEGISSGHLLVVIRFYGGTDAERGHQRIVNPQAVGQE